MVKFVLHFLFLVAGVAYLVAARASASTGSALGWFSAGIVVERRLRRRCSCSSRERGGNLDTTVLSPLTGGASSINIYGAVEGRASTGRTR